MPGHIDVETLEQVARVLGERWARRIYRELKNKPPAWPRTPDQARELLDEMLAGKVPRRHRQALAMIVERSARAAWNRFVRIGAADLSSGVRVQRPGETRGKKAGLDSR
jgi:hypothetical protein